MTLKECYEMMGGDYEEVIDRLPREASIVKYLKKYVDSNEFDKMLEAYNNKDYKCLFEETHNIKGMSANLSISVLGKTVSEICEAVRNGDPQIDLEPIIERAKEEYAIVVAAVGQLEG